MGVRIERDLLLARQIRRMDRNVRNAMVEVTLLVRGESQKITPIDTGNLKASAYTRVMVDRDGALGVVGYMASYAPFVHENLEANWQSPRAESQFLKKAVDRNRETVLEVFRKWASSP